MLILKFFEILHQIDHRLIDLYFGAMYKKTYFSFLLIIIDNKYYNF